MSRDKEMPEKADLKSLDISEANREKLKQLFPSVFTETNNDDGELVESVDFEKLKAELGTFSDVFESRRERYGMDWPGKKDCMKLIQKPSVATLKPCREESVNFDETENLFIEGDNLEVLKLMQKSYYGKIKMIYIDPPYNTGKEFIYPDDYSESLDTYLAYAGLIDDEGKKFSTNTANEGRFHTRWLNMLYPRLYLARNLLRDDGLIFISIDDNECINLRKLCDEVFGEHNFIATFCWQKFHSVKSNAEHNVSQSHDFIHCYAKQRDGILLNKLPMSEEALSVYKNPDNDPRGDWRTAPLTVSLLTGSRGESFKRTGKSTGLYEITSPKGKIHKPTAGRCWVSRARVDELIADNRIWWGKNGDAVPMQKIFISEKGGTKTVSTFWGHSDFGSNKKANEELKLLFPENTEESANFPTPKPTKLLRTFLDICSDKDGDGIYLDFFAGSSSTADAVLRNNNDKGEKRRFIMVQLPEPIDRHESSSNIVYESVSDIGKERIRRVIEKIKEEQANSATEAEGDLIKSQEEQPSLDLGFKVLKLDKSNFSIWDGSKPEPTEEKIAEQLDSHIDHIDTKASQEDILYELLLKAGFKPTERVEQREFAGKTVFSIAEGLLLICLEDEITKELVDAVAEAEPMQFICLDRGFMGNDQLKANAVQTFSARNQGRDKTEQIIFRTI